MGRLKIQTILDELIHIPSLTGDMKICRKIVGVIKTFLHKQKVSSKILRIEGRPVLIWGETNLAKAKWLINSHIDVVPGKPEQFKLKIINDKIWGRGSADTKGSVAILLANAAKWKKMATNKHITFMLVTDEEIGGNSTKQILKNMINLKGAIFLEPTEEKIITQAKGIMQVKIETTGKSSHGSRPWEGINALEQLMGSLSLFRTHHHNPKNETRETTFNFSILEVGTVINQVPEKATLWCDVRWNPKDSPQKIIKEFRNNFDKSNVEAIKIESPVNCSKDSIILTSLFRAMQQNNINPVVGFEHGSSDARHCTAKKIPAIIFGPNGKNSHADNEWVSLKSLEKVSNVLNTWIGIDLDKH